MPPAGFGSFPTQISIAAAFLAQILAHTYSLDFATLLFDCEILYVGSALARPYLSRTSSES
jgi:hypothetical protein